MSLTAPEEYHLVNDIVITRDGEQSVDYLDARARHAARGLRGIPWSY